MTCLVFEPLQTQYSVDSARLNSILTRLSLQMLHMLVDFEAILQSAQSEGLEVLHHRESVHRPNL